MIHLIYERLLKLATALQNAKQKHSFTNPNAYTTMKSTRLLAVLMVVMLPLGAHSQKKTKDYRVVNRVLTPLSQPGYKGIALNAAQGDGAAWLKGVSFERWVVEFDVLGENKPGSSFVGLAFHALNDSTYDCVYFRPFNFVAEQQINRDHMVQYVSHPDFPWHKLRQEHTGVYEKEIIPEPDPNQWLRVRMEISDTEVQVFVNGATYPALRVKKLNTRTTGGIGFWTGTNSSGKFANLKMTPR